jgi:hypothetical protein
LPGLASARLQPIYSKYLHDSHAALACTRNPDSNARTAR